MDEAEKHGPPLQESSDSTVAKPSKKRFPWSKPEQGVQPEKEEPPKVSFRALFKYATSKEKIYMTIACISAAIHGALLPLFTIFFGQVIDETGSGNDREAVAKPAKWFLVLAAVAFVTSLIQIRFQIIVAQRVCARLRRMFFKSIMSQDFSWYDSNDGGELTSRVASDVNIIQAGIGDKVTTAVQFVATFIAGLVIAFAYGPILTLVVLSLAPLLMIGGAVFAKFASSSTEDGLGAYGAAGAVAMEVIGLIRIVTAYNGQKSELIRYKAAVEKAYRSNVKKGFFGGFFLGFTMFVIFCSYSVAFVYGAKRLSESGSGNGGTGILTSFFAVIIACVSIGQAAPSFQAFAAAQGAAPRIFEVIERKSKIDPLDDIAGDSIPDFKGHVEFSGVFFRYKRGNPSADNDSVIEGERPYVLENFSINAPPGTSHALVGPSGCGKSTTVRLIERFYDIEKGSVTLDGRDVRTLNVRWLRSQIGYVGQMPTLFMLSIRDNIALGAPMELVEDESSKERVWRRKMLSDDEIIEAAKMANAHDFIMKLPEKYNTMLGERGALLSGGQKQRICIARALVRNPKILVLDESTAALDAQSERVVQLALEKAAAGRTTITIAHRLSTVRNADVISVLDKGYVVEAGRHKELMNIKDGAYRTLVEHQNIEALKASQEKSVAEGEEIGEAQALKDSVTKTKKSKTKMGEVVEEEEAPPVDKGIYLRAFRYNRQEIPIILLGVIGSAAAGAAFPISAILFSEAIFEITGNNNNQSTVRKYALLYLAVGGAAFLGNFLQQSMMTLSGERLTKKLRVASFEAILNQDIGFFDEKENAQGSLVTRLATEATAVQGITGGTLGAFAFAMGAILTGFIVSYVACWRVALIVTAIFPLMAFSGALQVKMMAGFDADADKKYQNAGAVASEAVDNYETVTASGVQDVFTKKYNDELNIPLVNGQKTALLGGVAFGISEFLSFALWAVAFWVGSIFLENPCRADDYYKAITGLLFGGMMLGQMSTTMPDVSKSKVAATKIFRLLDRETKINPSLDSGSRNAVVGNVSLEDVEFEYPTRPDVPVLRKLSVAVGHGKTLALVGASGCGKSTVIGLLERFYDPRSGRILVDGTKLDELNVGWARRHMSLVSQEPDLFNRSVRDNIAYGLDHEEGTVVTDDMIVEAARQANAHSFISELSDGYDTIVGPRGSKLSGGQRQRVAIARAIVRHPKILLLDEATSALDAVSERLVQSALDHVSAERTTVAIAHRLSTVKDADAIAVVARGKIVEIGTHEQLLRLNGEYAMLVKNQLSGDNEN